MPLRFFSPNIPRTVFPLTQFDKFFPYDRFKFSTTKQGAHFPYPILSMGAHRKNNALHEAILKDDLERLREQALVDPSRLSGLSWGNTPLLLSLKRGNLQAARVVIEVMNTTLSQDDSEHIFAERDSMGLMALSYALFLRVPYDVMESCLSFTPRKNYFTDDVYRLFVEGLTLDGKKNAFNITERGYELKKGQGGFAIYELSPMMLYSASMPERIAISGDIIPEQDFGIIEIGGNASLSYYQVLRNLLFHTRALCENRGVLLDAPPNDVLCSDAELAYDVLHNYPRLAKARNNTIDPSVRSLIESWISTPFDLEWEPLDDFSP